MANQRICSIEGCGKPARGRGWCSKHYTRWLRNGDPLVTKTAPTGEPIRFFWDVVLPYKGDDCLYWPYGTSGSNRGLVRWNGQDYLVSRLVCIMRYGLPPTPKHEAAHNCGKSHEGCCNPRHLHWATRAENEADKELHGTRQYGEKAPWSKLTEDDIREIRHLCGEMTQREIAVKFNICQQMVSHIHRNSRWKRLD